MIIKAHLEPIRHNKPREGGLTLYLIETLFNTFANREDSDQAALVRAA